MPPQVRARAFGSRQTAAEHTKAVHAPEVPAEEEEARKAIEEHRRAEYAVIHALSGVPIRAQPNPLETGIAATLYADYIANVGKVQEHYLPPKTAKRHALAVKTHTAAVRNQWTLTPGDTIDVDEEIDEEPSHQSDAGDDEASEDGVPSTPTPLSTQDAGCLQIRLNPSISWSLTEAELGTPTDRWLATLPSSMGLPEGLLVFGLTRN